MKKQIFKPGDRVFYYTKGWGIVKTVYNKEPFPEKLCVSVKFDDKLIDTVHFTYRQSALLSFTEYTLLGFSQKRPIKF